jgi:hypothetical protein
MSDKRGKRTIILLGYPRDITKPIIRKKFWLIMFLMSSFYLAANAVYLTLAWEVAWAIMEDTAVSKFVLAATAATFLADVQFAKLVEDNKSDIDIVMAEEKRKLGK